MAVDSPTPPPSPAPAHIATEPVSRTTSHANTNHAPLFGQPPSALAKFCAKMTNPSINSFSGAMAGVASGIVTCPLDVIKTRLQSQGSFTRNNRPSQRKVYNGLIGTARVIWREDGTRGLYRGLGPMLLGYLPTWAVYMSVYDSSKEFYRQHIDNPWVARVSASISAGACSTLVTNPIWVIKTRLMSQVSARAVDSYRTPWYYKSTWDAAGKIYRTEGLRAFYSGLTPALLGLTHVAIQFPLYEYFKMQFTGLEMGETTEKDEHVHTFGILAATFLSKICATSATYPHEVLRTRLQTQQRSIASHQHQDDVAFRGGSHQTRPPAMAASSDNMPNLPRYRGILRTCRTIIHEEGWRAFYYGMGTNMVRAVPAAMTTMLTYETLKKACFELKVEGMRACELGETR